MHATKIVVLYALLNLPLLISATPLDDYVWKDDGYYHYTVIKDWTHKFGDHTSFLINMTSQKWLTDKDTTRSVWWHYVVIHVPDNIDPSQANSAFLFIDGGSNSDPESTPEHDDIMVLLTGLMADSTKSIVVDLRQIPNQPIVFTGDPRNKSRHEDSLVAYTWGHYLNDPTTPELLLWFPMTKAAIKAMDTVTDFVNKTYDKNIKNFCVGGASKRGWVTWLAGAVDYERVKCITPIVMDDLNIIKNLHHHYRAYGGWSFAIDAYYAENVTTHLDYPSMVSFAALVDPFSYLDRLTMPKLITSSGGDEFFLLDDSHYYFKSMKGPTYVNMLQNSDHTCVGHIRQILKNIENFHISVAKNYNLPDVSWELYSTPDGGGIDVKMDRPPTLIKAWSATTISSTRRDFRLLCGNPNNPNAEPIVQLNLWFHSDVVKLGDLKYRVRFDNAIPGHWKAFFIQMTFPGPDGKLLEVTTETNIIPNTFPFPDCHMESCKGIIV